MYYLNEFSSLILLFAACIILFSKDFLLIIPFLCVFSLCITCKYLLLMTPDVAITEVCVATTLSSIMILIAYYKTKQTVNEKYKIDYFSISSLIIIIFASFNLIKEIPEFASAFNPIHSNVADYYINNHFKEIGIESVVTSILASYRGFDTMAETMVILIAGIGVSSIMKKK